MIAATLTDLGISLIGLGVVLALLALAWPSEPQDFDADHSTRHRIDEVDQWRAERDERVRRALERHSRREAA